MNTAARWMASLRGEVVGDGTHVGRAENRTPVPRPDRTTWVTGIFFCRRASTDESITRLRWYCFYSPTKIIAGYRNR